VQDYDLSAPPHLLRCTQGIRITLLLGRGSVYYQLMDVVKAGQDYKHAYDLAGGLADIRSQADALLLLGNIAMRQADYIHAQTVVHQAIQRLAVLGDSDSLARARLLLGRIAARRGELRETTYYVALAAGKESADPPSDPGCMQAIGVYNKWLETVFLTNRSLPALELEVGERTCASKDVGCFLWLAEIAVWRGRWGDALELVHQGMAFGWTSGTPLDVADAKSVLAFILMQAGVYQDACDYLDEALAAFAEAGWTTGLVDGYWLSGEILLALGRYELAAERFDQALKLGRETHTVQAIVHAQIGLGKLAIVREQWREGKRLCTEARAQAMWAKLGPSAISARLGLARVHLACQEWQLAYRQAKLAHDLGDQLGFPGDVLTAATMLGEALVGLGQVDRAQQCFQEAYSVAVQLADMLPFHYARAFWSKPAVRALRDYLVD
jgi:tetratricopeptide (TPR) repeat protein